ncbi:hypothetical protein SIN8267_01829 [Sinobacterium norvegicum]|uniref:Uncharacterized protein n=1 Tax=Sinobacterium norvegicum TaxID=1641715 RepID=A0ABN8EH32_9GAMM|nr:hypothetical protein [Sinobacterium norvegicum]CAH0991715.1 hypothetical protein SIN8267_01829 [Sinobacterium norvegicum]
MLTLSLQGGIHGVLREGIGSSADILGQSKNHYNELGHPLLTDHISSAAANIVAEASSAGMLTLSLQGGIHGVLCDDIGSGSRAVLMA